MTNGGKRPMDQREPEDRVEPGTKQAAQATSVTTDESNMETYDIEDFDIKWLFDHDYALYHVPTDTHAVVNIHSGDVQVKGSQGNGKVDDMGRFKSAARRKAVVSGEKPNIDRQLAQLSLGIHRDAYDAAQRAQTLVKEAEAVWSQDAVETASQDTSDDADSRVSGEDSPRSGSFSDDSEDQATMDAVNKLQRAFEDLEGITDMRVQGKNGKVWFQTGPETPDEWPFPGGNDTWEVLVKEPDMVSYVYDGIPDWADGPHAWADDKPGEWWKNAMKPEDVEDYIDEVLA